MTLRTLLFLSLLLCIACQNPPFPESKAELAQQTPVATKPSAKEPTPAVWIQREFLDQSKTSEGITKCGDSEPALPVGIEVSAKGEIVSLDPEFDDTLELGVLQKGPIAKPQDDLVFSLLSPAKVQAQFLDDQDDMHKVEFSPSTQSELNEALAQRERCNTKLAEAALTNSQPVTLTDLTNRAVVAKQVIQTALNTPPSTGDWWRETAVDVPLLGAAAGSYAGYQWYTRDGFAAKQEKKKVKIEAQQAQQAEIIRIANHKKWEKAKARYVKGRLGSAKTLRKLLEQSNVVHTSEGRQFYSYLTELRDTKTPLPKENIPASIQHLLATVDNAVLNGLNQKAVTRTLQQAQSRVSRLPTRQTYKGPIAVVVLGMAYLAAKSFYWKESNPVQEKVYADPVFSWLIAMDDSQFRVEVTKQPELAEQVIDFAQEITKN